MKNIHNIINDSTSKDEILDIIISDDDIDMKKKISYYMKKATSRKYDTSVEILMKFEIVGKSGQLHKYAIFPIFTKNREFTGYCGTFHYITYKSKFDTVYISFGIDEEDGLDITESMSREHTNVYRFTNHVISRYGERCKKDYHGEDGFLKFSVENASFTPIEYGDNDSRVFMRTQKGVLLGNVVNGIYYINTFITKNMVRGCRQNYMFNQNNVPEEAEAYNIKLMLSSLMRRYSKQSMDNIGNFIEEMNEILDNAPKEFYKSYFGIENKDEFLNMLKSKQRLLNGKTSLCTITAPGNEHDDKRKYKLCVETCIPGRTERVQEIKKFGSMPFYENCVI